MEKTRKKSNISIVLVGKFLGAESIYMAKSRVARNQNPKKCVCNVKFNRNDALTCHQSRACKGADYKKCSVCGKTFSQLSNLKHHTLLHTNEKDQAKISSFYVKIIC